MNITLNITQCCRCNNYTKVTENSYVFNSTSEQITLFNGYTLSIISYTANSINILIEDDNNMYIRTLSTMFPFEICLPVCNNCYYHIMITTSINQ